MLQVRLQRCLRSGMARRLRGRLPGWDGQVAWGEDCHLLSRCVCCCAHVDDCMSYMHCFEPMRPLGALPLLQLHLFCVDQ